MKAIQDFEVLKQNPLFLVGISLYWGEGSKTHNGRVSVINSDVNMLKLVKKFYTEILSVSDKKLRIELFVHQDLDEETERKFWSNQLQIPTSQFIKTQVLPKRGSQKRAMKHGLCALYFSNTAMSIKILEWIRLLGEKNAGIAQW